MVMWTWLIYTDVELVLQRSECLIGWYVARSCFKLLTFSVIQNHNPGYYEVLVWYLKICIFNICFLTNDYLHTHIYGYICIYMINSPSFTTDLLDEARKSAPGGRPERRKDVVYKTGFSILLKRTSIERKVAAWIFTIYSNVCVHLISR